MMDDARIPRRHRDMVSRVIADETILLPVYKTSDEINCIYTLNPAAAWVWDMIDGKKSFAQIKKRAVDAFDADEAAVSRRLEKLFQELEEIRAVE